MFQCWLESTPQASYHQLVVALRNTADYSLAEELCKKYSKRLLIGNYSIGQTYTSRTFSLSKPEATRDEVQPNYLSSSVTIPKQQGTYSSVRKITKHEVVFSMLITGLMMLVEVTYFYCVFSSSISCDTYICWLLKCEVKCLLGTFWVSIVVGLNLREYICSQYLPHTHPFLCTPMHN